ncbi:MULTISPECIES: bifunctional glutamate N-acetyltransferase/amino-acid acetyltransferase ArgJ [Thiorhodovibrio]|uniref:bifunctional glutamate N-acetyltransferase/amino-acid acetyltransferase ArgJ n=1 Tax=Thiorhodovibrio TaxID=61593 RepID=UPI0019113860|nr:MULTISPECIES: bifunctional glutamate N-acetyltransferase/amino-acid acetyltransferase ArgJ [Thiorhodovibrio]MBK5968219.1 bifunctional ornithine acetyltransferase/N-acetylglutamate synthase [Thiorhodovibrio winogradskyi]WPL14773.1 Arginine biosynthesis bifunctional protein ArgJ [Thiorhodovibrio litoralis]
MSDFQVAGVRLAAHAAGVRYADRDDLVLVELAPGAQCAGVFTRNAFCAAPVELARTHLQQESPRFWLINSGNANAGTGARGLNDARECCQSVANAGGVAASEVLPFSTGVIGEDLPVGRIVAAVPELFAKLEAAGWELAARAIMTTDTKPKLVKREVRLGEHTATLVGMAKGAGMICPNMATMLAFIATDAAAEAPFVRAALQQAVAGSFNAISIDGDTSTNDACMLAATGRLGNPPLAWPEQPESRAFQQALDSLCLELATAIVRDGEGATKLVRIEVSEAESLAEAREVAATIAHSPLVKTALFAGDPNWGRILAAVGRAKVPGLAIEPVSLWLDEVCIVSGGGRDPNYREQDGARVMGQDDFRIGVRLGRGRASATMLTCDLSYDYVRINAEYRS